MRTRPCVRFNLATRVVEVGLLEVFIPMLLNGRNARSPGFTPYHLLMRQADRRAVEAWAQVHHPNLLQRRRGRHG